MSSSFLNLCAPFRYTFTIINLLKLLFAVFVAVLIFNTVVVSAIYKPDYFAGWTCAPNASSCTNSNSELVAAFFAAFFL